MDPSPVRLPKSLEGTPPAVALLEGLAANAAPMFEGGTLAVPCVALDSRLVDVLKGANLSRRLIRGLERADSKLSAENHGLALADRSSGVERGERVSRLLLIASGGGKGFYKRVEKLLQREGPRVMAIRLDATSIELGAPLFGAERGAQLVMLAHKDSVVASLLAIAARFDTP